MSNDAAAARELAALRREYSDRGLTEAEAGHEPHALFGRWLRDALDAHAGGLLVEPNAMALATVHPDGAPSVRVVLLKGLLDGAPVFYSNRESVKGVDLAADNRCAATLLWHDLQRQVRFEGTAEPLPAEASDAYFATRPRGSQLGAWASPQSRVVADRDELVRAYEAAASRFAEPASISRPPHWGGWRVVPHTVEFWQGRPGRMHDRIRFTRHDGRWARQRLAP
jgi:pyridoxamine 5'-phosphate oxidase